MTAKTRGPAPGGTAAERDKSRGKRVRPYEPLSPAAAENPVGNVHHVQDSGALMAFTGAFLDLTHFGEVFRVEPSVRIVAIKKGVQADVFGRIARYMDRSKEQLGKTLGLSVTTVDRKAKAGQPLSPEYGERLVGIARLIGQVQTMVEQSGNAEGFDAARWLGRWLDEPLPALGGGRPAELMDTAEGRALVSNLLATAQSGAYG